MYDRGDYLEFNVIGWIISMAFIGILVCFGWSIYDSYWNQENSLEQGTIVDKTYFAAPFVDSDATDYEPMIYTITIADEDERCDVKVNKDTYYRYKIGDRFKK